MRFFSKKLQLVLIMSLLLKIFGLLHKILTARILGLEGMRLLSMISPLLALCLSVSSFSIQAVCNQNVSLNITTKNYKTSTIMLAALRVTFIASSVVSILMILSFPIYKYIYQESFIYYPLLLCVPLIYLSNISGLMKGYLEANNRFSLTYFSNVIESGLKLLLTVILLLIFKNYDIKIQVFLCFLALMLSEISSCLILVFKIKKGKKINLLADTNKYEIKILKQAIPLTLESLLNTFAGYITPFIFYHAAGKLGYSFYDSTSYYSLVTSFAIPLLINGQFSTLTITKLLFPSITKNRDNINTLSPLLNKAFFLVILLSIFSFTLCYFKGEEVLLFLYNDSSSYMIVKSLAVVYILVYFNPLFITILQAYNKEKTLFFITLSAHIISMVLIYFLSSNQSFGLSGYIVGISISTAIKSILLILATIINTKFKLDFKLMLFPIILSICYIAINCYIKTILGYLLLSLLYLGLGFLLFYLLYNNTQSFHHNKKRT